MSTMKFILIAGLFAVALSAPLEEQPIRLPLPEEIARLHPELLTEPITTPGAKVVGGSNAASGEAPWQIALLAAGSFTCGGSLITSRSVLTAAHCVAGNENNPSRFTVRYNTLDRTSGPTLTVSRVVRHASYSSSTIDYDVAILQLASAFTPGTNAAVATLTSSNPSANAAVTVTGWGRLSSGGSLPTYLQKATSLRVIATATCQSQWGSTNSITARMLCAHSSSQSACNGDSGGPLTANGVQVGVVSWGPSTCLSSTYPTVYASVANLRSWITSNSV